MSSFHGTLLHHGSLSGTRSSLASKSVTRPTDTPLRAARLLSMGRLLGATKTLGTPLRWMRCAHLWRSRSVVLFRAMAASSSVFHTHAVLSATLRAFLWPHDPRIQGGTHDMQRVGFAPVREEVRSGTTLHCGRHIGAVYESTPLLRQAFNEIDLGFLRWESSAGGQHEACSVDLVGVLALRVDQRISPPAALSSYPRAGLRASGHRPFDPLPGLRIDEQRRVWHVLEPYLTPQW